MFIRARDLSLFWVRWTVQSLVVTLCRLRLKCDGTRAETRFRLSAKRTNPFKSAEASVQSTTGSWGVRISGSNAGYTMFRGSVKSTGYLLHSPVSPSLPLPCVTVCHHFNWTLPPALIFNKIGSVRINVTVRRVRLTIVARKSRRITYSECVSAALFTSMRRACAVLYCHLWLASCSMFFHIIFLNLTIFRKKVIEHKIVCFDFVYNFAWEISDCEKNSAGCCH
jgi:hypothetical protein